MSGPAHMEHQDIQESNLVERYLMGKLPVQERARFEEHFIDCAECLDRIKTTAELRQALKLIAAEDALRQSAYVRAGLLGWLARAARRQRAALLTGALLIIVTASGVLVLREITRSRNEAAQAKMNSAQLERLYEEAQQQARNKEQELRQAEQRLADERRRREEAQQQAQQARVSASAGLARPARPQTTIPVFTLDADRVRSADAARSQNVTTITLPPSSGWIMLAFEQELAPEYESYEATITSADGRLIAKQSNLKPNAQDIIFVSLQSQALRPGNYLLTLKGVTSTGRAFSAAKHHIRIARE